MMQSPSFLRRNLARYAQVEPKEVPAVLAAFCLFFFVLGSYFAVRPVRETIATLLGSEKVADLWLYTALFSIAIVPVYGWLVARIRRSILLPFIYAVVAVTLAVIGSVIQVDERNLQVGTFFYVWISVLNLMLVSVFWSFLLEMFSSEQVKRLFGFIAAGGTLGALFGPLAAGLLVGRYGNSGVLYLSTAGFIGAIICQRILISIWNRQQEDAHQDLSDQPLENGLGGNPLSGISLVLKSRYLLKISVFVVLLSVVNSFLYFEQLRIVTETFTDTARRTEVFATIDFIVQGLTIFSQLFLTGRIASKLGVRSLLTFVPIIMIFGFMLLSVLNIFSVIAALLIVRRWGEYSFIRPGREMLWSMVDIEAKYKAKNFIDVPVYRAADYVGAQAKSAIAVMGTSPGTVALIGAAMAAIWALNGWNLGSQHDKSKELET